MSINYFGSSSPSLFCLLCFFLHDILAGSFSGLLQFYNLNRFYWNVHKTVHVIVPFKRKCVYSKYSIHTELICQEVSCYWLKFNYHTIFCVIFYHNGSAIFTVDEKFKQYVCIKFWIKLSKAETLVRFLRNIQNKCRFWVASVFQSRSRASSIQHIICKMPENVKQIGELILMTNCQLSQMTGIRNGIC